MNNRGKIMGNKSEQWQDMPERLQAILLVFTLTTCTAPVVAQQITWSGFADVLYTRQLSDTANGNFGYGQFEIDFSAVVLPNVNFIGAISYSAGSGHFIMGAGFLDISLNGSAPDGKGAVKHTGVMLGRFDVPFGIDYTRIPSPNRRLVSIPLLTQKTVNCWNDIGLNLYGELALFNYNFFIVNGAENGSAMGSRITIPLGESMEFGGSFAMQTAKNDANAIPKIYGVDFQSTLGPVKLSFEYQQAAALLEGDFNLETEDCQHNGYYGEVDWDVTSFSGLPIFLIGRYGAWEMDNDDQVSQIAAGMGYKFGKGFEMRAEYLSDQVQHYNPENHLTMQAVVSF